MTAPREVPLGTLTREFPLDTDPPVPMRQRLQRGTPVIVLLRLYETWPPARAGLPPARVGLRLVDARVRRSSDRGFTWVSKDASGTSRYVREGTGWCRAGDPVAAQALLAAAALMDELP